MKLKRLREARGLSQYALAKKAKISRVYVNKLEEGHSDPTVGMVQRLAKALGVPVTALLESIMTDAGDRLSRFLVAHNGPPLTPVKETGMDREHPTALALEREASIT